MVTDSNVAPIYLNAVKNELLKDFDNVFEYVIPAGEENKTLDVSKINEAIKSGELTDVASANPLTPFAKNTVFFPTLPFSLYNSFNLYPTCNDVSYIWWSFNIAEIASITTSLIIFMRLYKNTISKIPSGAQ